MKSRGRRPLDFIRIILSFSSSPDFSTKNVRICDKYVSIWCHGGDHSKWSNFQMPKLQVNHTYSEWNDHGIDVVPGTDPDIIFRQPYWWLQHAIIRCFQPSRSRSQLIEIIKHTWTGWSGWYPGQIDQPSSCSYRGTALVAACCSRVSAPGHVCFSSYGAMWYDRSLCTVFPIRNHHGFRLQQVRFPQLVWAWTDNLIQPNPK